MAPSLGPRYHLYNVVGRHQPTEKDPEPTVFRMKLWSTNRIRARSKFWFFLRKLKKVKKSVGETIAVNEIFEKEPTVVKNYGIWIRVQSRTGFHNMYKEYRDTTLNGAVAAMYDELGGRHRVRAPCIQIIKTATVPDENCKRLNTTQFHGTELRFPLTHKLVRPASKSLKTTYKYARPSVAI